MVALLTLASPYFENAIPGIAYTLPYFAGGVLMCWIHRRYGTNIAGVAISVLLIIAAVFNLQAYAFALFGAYLIIFLGERPNLGSRIAEKLGDCSYGLYLYGWPVEQIVKQLTNTNDPFRIFLLALPLTFALALISCHAIEKPAMRLRISAAAHLKRGIASIFAAFPGARRPALFGAKASFVMGAMFILTSKSRWWFVLESMSEIVLAVIAGSIIAVGLSHATEKLVFRLRVRHHQHSRGPAADG